MGATAEACERLAPWSRLGDSARQMTAPLPLGLSLGAMLAPLAMAPTGLDHELRLIAQGTLGGRPNLEPVSVWTPFVLPVVLIGLDSVALGLDACEVARPSSAMLQSIGTTLLAVVAMKWVTGRSWPNAGRDPRAPDRLEHPEYARTFHWFSWSQGSAWPSGHTATMAAAAAALTTVARGRSWLGYLAIAAATGVAAGMWLGDHHWGSDIASGGLLGTALGHGIGLAFRDEAPPRTAFTYTVAPWSRRDVEGIQLLATW